MSTAPVKIRVLSFTAFALCALLSFSLFLDGEANDKALSADARVSLQVDSTPIDRSTNFGRSSYANILNKATPAIVGVYTSKIVRFRSNPRLNPLDEFLRRYYGLPSLKRSPSSIEEEKVPAGIGSGVIVSPEGHILTNAHVILDQRTGDAVDEVIVKLGDKREFDAKIIGFDKATDVAVLKIDASEVPTVTLGNSDNLRVGDVVFAAGNPLGVGLTVTMGIVSATGRTNLGILNEPGSYEHFIQTDAAINMGNSGGALIDSKGRLIGINTAIYSRTGGNIGIGFAIPVNLAKSILVSLVETGDVDRGFLGVQLGEVNTDAATELSLPGASGALVNGVVPNSPADKAGLQANDVIISLGEQPVKSVAELRVFISRTPPGEPVRIGFYRKGRRDSVKVSLGHLGKIADKNGDEATPFPGLQLRPADAVLRRKFDIPQDVSGLIVTQTSGEISSLREGVVVMEINGKTVVSIEEAHRLVERGLNRLYVWFRGRHSYVPYRIP